MIRPERKDRHDGNQKIKECTGRYFIRSAPIRMPPKAECISHIISQIKQFNNNKTNMLLRFLLINRINYFMSWVIPAGTNVVLDDERTSHQYEIVAIPKYAENVVDCLSQDFLDRHKWIEQILTNVLAIAIDRESDLKADGPEDFEEHVLCNVVARILFRARGAGRVNSTVPLTMRDVVDISQDCYDKAAVRFTSGVTTFHYKFIAVKRELMKLDYIPDSLWREIRDECIVLPIQGQYHAAIVEDDDDEMEPWHEPVQVVRTSEM